MKLARWIVTLTAMVALAVFAVANLDDVALWPLPAEWRLPLGIVVVLALLAGFIVGELAAWIGGRRRRREARHHARRLAALEHELAATQSQLGGTAGGLATGGLAAPPALR